MLNPELQLSLKGIRFFCKVFLITFLIVVFLFESLSVYLSYRSTSWDKTHSLGESSIRFRKEGTAVELYAEDIWQNKRRTLKTPFDPFSCTTKYLNKWRIVLWSEVECVADDETGRRWRYIARYSNDSSPKFFIPFFIDIGPTRELKITPGSFNHEGLKK